jgi:transcriptional regulator with XRE-family HTH domain
MSLDDLRTAIAAAVRAELARKGMSQRDLAGLLGIDPQAISLRCRGERSFRAEELVALAFWLDTPLKDFVPEAVIV